MDFPDGAVMSKRRWMLCLTVLGLATITCLISLKVRGHMPLRYYLDFPGPHRLPEEFIRPAFRSLGGFELPEQATDLEAIFKGGRDAGIFLKFHTDARGFEQIKEKFGGPGVETKEYGPTGLPLHIGIDVFYIPSAWERRLGVCIFDQNSIESGRTLEHVAISGSYTVFLDDRSGVIYLWVQHH
jgi:hypothetical protein